MTRVEILARTVERTWAATHIRTRAESVRGRLAGGEVRELLSGLADELQRGAHIPGATVVLATSEAEPEAPAPVHASPKMSVDEIDLCVGRLIEERDLATSAEGSRGHCYRVALRRWSGGQSYALVGRYQRRDDGTLGPVKGGKHLALAPDELRAVAAALLDAARAVETEPTLEVREAS
jgi:hypothetical protein